VSRRWLAVVLLASVAALPAVDAPAAPERAAAKAKKCKRGKVAVVVEGKRKCRPLRKAIPRPKRGNSKLIYASAALDANLTGVRDRRGRRPPSIEKAMRRISPRAVARMDGVLKRGLALLDRAKAQVAQGGGSVGFTYNLGNGASFDVRADLARANLEVALTGRRDGQTVRTRIGVKQDLGFRGPQCPTAQGVLEAKDGLRLSITVELLDDDGSVDYYYTQVVFQDTKLRGTVGVDAKLDKLKVEDKLQLGEMTGGSIFGGINIQSEIKRQTTVDMKTGNYDPGRSNVQVSVALSGILRIFQSSAQAGATARIQAAADKGFAATVDRAIENYRERERAWQTPNKCAKLEFTPGVNSRTLRPSERGNFTARAIAQEGGGGAELDAQLSSQLNASFSPARVRGPQARFEYTVFPVPSGGKVRASIRATSKAGVAADPWEQNVQPPFTIHNIAGNFSGSVTQSIGGENAVISWTGSATFERTVPAGIAGAFGTYVLKAGSVSVHYSGREITGSADCDMSGSTFVDLFQHGSGSITVTPQSGAIFEQGPHDYGITTVIGPTPRITITWSNCVDPMANGMTFELPVGISPLTTVESHVSPDGIKYSGMESSNQAGLTAQTTWALTGTPQ
jgi:hypothetical protein